MRKRPFAFLILLITAHFSAWGQDDVLPMVKSFVATVADTVEQDKPFTVVYTLTARSWKAGGKPLQGKGFLLKGSKHETVNADPYMKLKVMATYITSRSGIQELPGMTIPVGDRVVKTEKKCVYVKPHAAYGEEMTVASKWLVSQGQHPDSLCLSMQINDHGFWLFNDAHNHCFCMVAKKDVWPLVGNPVLAYSTENDIYVKDNLQNYNDMVNPYRLQIAALKETVGKVLPVDTLFYQPQHEAIAPLLGLTKWGQYEPYNLFSPVYQGKKTLIGCVPLAMGMIVHYHQWPEKGQWQSFQKSYEAKDSIADIAELSRMLVFLGYAVDAEFSHEATAAETGKVKSTLCNNLQYSGRLTHYQELSDAQLTGILYRDLDHRLPCIVSHDTHVFVCDGYKGDFLHFNLGWYGNFNGYYRLKLGNYDSVADGSLILIKNVFAHIEPQREDMVREINMEQPGTLQQMLTTEEQSQVTTLKINGPLNSADIRLLRRMAGADKQPVFADGWQGGALCELDLQNAIITGDDTPYLTMRATGSWTQRVRVANNVKKVVTYDFDKMTETEWKSFEANIGTKKDGFFYTRTDDNRYWVHYTCQDSVIGNHMFAGCTSLRKILLPNQTRKIDDYAFFDCPALQTITIPPTTTELGQAPFSGDVKVTKKNGND